jgi:uncharacterized membrane protein
MPEENWLTKNRLETLVDGIFAIAMTLLVLALKVPQMTHKQAATGLSEALGGLRPHFTAFVISFFLLAIFWMAHHRQFKSIKKVDSNFIWLNILMLLLIVLVPFSTSLMGEYELARISYIFFDLNLFFIGISMFLYWWYAGKNNRLMVDGFTREQYLYGIKRNAVLPAVSLIALALTFVTPRYSSLAFLAIPVIMSLFVKKR